jgi:hypothetical protein
METSPFEKVATALSLQQHRPVQIDEVKQS